jgi:hypothetical protein
MKSIPDSFSASYAQARVQFLEAAATAGASIQSFAHPLKGVSGEDLAMDVALDGSPDAQRMLVVSSACHGVEGYCGSGVQVFALHDAQWREKAKACGVAVLYIHALNPYGFSFTRRVTHENVDLNRNFQDFSKPLPVNVAYTHLHDVMLPKEWPPTPQNIADTQAFIAEHGLQAMQAAVTGGQYKHADGLFFGGQAATWSNSTVREVVRQYCRGTQQLAWIDLHTGLGPSGYGERIYAGRNEAEQIARAHAWWGNTGVTHPDGRVMDGVQHSAITSTYDGSSTSAQLSGMMNLAICDEAPQAQYTAMALEYGTVPVLQVLAALRGDHWLHREDLAERNVPEPLRAQIRQAMKEAFFTDTDAWKGQIISQARQAMFQAADGMQSR